MGTEHDRITRLETDQQYMQQTLRKLVDVTGEVSHAVKKLADHQEVLSKLDRAREDHKTRLVLLEKFVEDNKELPDKVSRNTTITKAALWIAGLAVTALVMALPANFLQ